MIPEEGVSSKSVKYNLIYIVTERISKQDNGRHRRGHQVRSLRVLWIPWGGETSRLQTNSKSQLLLKEQKSKSLKEI